MHNQAFNIGVSEENYRVRDLVDVVLEAVPGSTAVYTGEGPEDARDYRVDFSKFARSFPDFKMQHTVRDGAYNLIEGFRKYGMSLELMDSSRFIRLKTLKERLADLNFDERTISERHQAVPNR